MTLSRGLQALPDGLLPVGHLFWVLSGSIRLYWLGESGITVTLSVARAGETLGEEQCHLFDTPSRSHKMHIDALTTQREKYARLLQLGPSIVEDLLKIGDFRRRLERRAWQRTLGISDLARFHVLRNIGLAIAHWCVSTNGGENFEYHDVLIYQGEPLVRHKKTTLDELRHLAGVSLNSVRKWLRALERAGYIRISSTRFQDTHITVVDPEGLLAALDVGRLDIEM